MGDCTSVSTFGHSPLEEIFNWGFGTALALSIWISISVNVMKDAQQVVTHRHLGQIKFWGADVFLFVLL